MVGSWVSGGWVRRDDLPRQQPTAPTAIYHANTPSPSDRTVGSPGCVAIRCPRASLKEPARRPDLNCLLQVRTNQNNCRIYATRPHRPGRRPGQRRHDGAGQLRPSLFVSAARRTMLSVSWVVACFWCTGRTQGLATQSSRRHRPHRQRCRGRPAAAVLGLQAAG